MANKYAYINDLALLKKPKKKILSMGPDLANFVTTSSDLKRLANFGLEMMKFLPKFEQLTYAGKMGAKEGEGHVVEHGILTDKNGQPILDAQGQTQKRKTEVSNEYWSALNEFGMTEEEFKTYQDQNPGEWNIRDYDVDGDGTIEDNEKNIIDPEERVQDYDHDGKITNADTIKWYENVQKTEWGNANADGFGPFRGSTWIAGQHHRVGSFGPWGSEDGSGIAGAGMGANFKNIEFMAEGSDWNHIYRRNSKTLDSTAIEDKAYFVKDILDKAGKSWSDVTRLLTEKFNGQSYYEIVMSKSYLSCTPEEAALLTAGMLESRERAWAAMTQLFGPVTSSRNDADMINAIDRFMKTQNTYTNSHELALFPLFFGMQHSFQNQVTMYYEEDKGEGYVESSMDKERFWDFSKWLGRESYGNNDYWSSSNSYVAENIDNSTDGITRGKLYECRDLLENENGSDRYRAVNELIERWFGATKAESGKPLWAGYFDKYLTPGDGNVSIDDFDSIAQDVSDRYGGGLGQVVIKQSIWDALKRFDYIDDDGKVKNFTVSKDNFMANFALDVLTNANKSAIFETLKAAFGSIMSAKWWDITSNPAWGSTGSWVPGNLPGVGSVYIWNPEVTYGSYGWDRKWNNDNIKYVLAGNLNAVQQWLRSAPAGVNPPDNDDPGTINKWKNEHPGVAVPPAVPNFSEWDIKWMNLRQQASPGLELNDRWKRGIHANYAISQLFGLDVNSVMKSADYFTNWVVHAVGSYLKNGEMMDMVRVMEKCSQKREASAAFKADSQDYMTRKDELENEKAMQEAAAAKAAAKARAWLNSKPQKGGTAATGKNSTAEAKKELQKALQKYANRVMRNSGKKREESMNKIRQATQGDGAQQVKKHRYAETATVKK